VKIRRDEEEEKKRKKKARSSIKRRKWRKRCQRHNKFKLHFIR